ncbi:MAG: CerR family C-terminal domain-containing protein [Candidatus Loosdrechtia sp.]|uniref:CerR family C-terminal domain-containing protein n=1 Tax=Candidatus Loosdrechtia sp. TaxID=3101272 RepID=UPI003A68671A|nr:MAG: CerR family C-terminal domain-containing protein [Candidatus Jettenia sp. AMX2]
MAKTIHRKTQQRLLEAAGEIFALHGFRKATIREICKHAHANVASVNYHFRNKNALYVAVLQYAHQCAVRKYPPDSGLRKEATAKERLRAFIRSLLLRFLDEGRTAWYGKLIAREMTEPTPALEILVEKEIRPLSRQLEFIVRELLNSPASDDLIQLCVRSILAQCIFYHHVRPVIDRLYPDQKYRPHDIERLADHITRFSLGAIKELKKQNTVTKKETVNVAGS